MTSPATPASGTFWATAGAGLVAGLLIVVLAFRITSPADTGVAAPADKPAITVLDDTSNTGDAEPSGSPTTSLAPDGPGDSASAPDEGTVVDTTAATTVPPEPKVEIRRSIGPCRYGSQCLIASFTISGFTETPPQFVCEFQDGSRFTFEFQGDTVENACSTGTVPGSITVEVLGVRSDVITNP